MAAELKEYIARDVIGKRIKELGREISTRYAEESVICVCVLKGAFLFFADLLREIKCEVEVDFIRLASYGSGTSSSGKIIFSKDLEISIENRNVLIIEDIVDSGRSMEYLLKVFAARNPKSLKVCALIDKQKRREVVLDIDFAGFNIADSGYLVGYGLDFSEKYRELDALYELVE